MATCIEQRTQTTKTNTQNQIGWGCCWLKKEKRCKGKASVVGRSCRGEAVMAEGGWSEEQGGGWSVGKRGKVVA